MTLLLALVEVKGGLTTVSSTNPFTDGVYFATMGYLYSTQAVVPTLVVFRGILGYAAQDLFTNNYCSAYTPNAFPPSFTSSIHFDYVTNVMKAEMAMRTSIETEPFTMFVNGPRLFIAPLVSACPAVVAPTGLSGTFYSTFLDCNFFGNAAFCALPTTTTVSVTTTTILTFPTFTTILSTIFITDSERTTITFLITTSTLSTDTSLTFETVSTTTRTTTTTTINLGSTGTVTDVDTSTQVWTDFTDATLTFSIVSSVTTSTTVSTDTSTFTTIVDTTSSCCP